MAVDSLLLIVLERIGNLEHEGFVRVYGTAISALRSPNNLIDHSSQIQTSLPKDWNGCITITTA